MSNILEVSGVSKDYGDFRLDDVSFSLPKGYIMGLIGPNGAGKTTFFNCLTGIYKPTSGNIFIRHPSRGTREKINGLKRRTFFLK